MIFATRCLDWPFGYYDDNVLKTFETFLAGAKD